MKNYYNIKAKLIQRENTKGKLSLHLSVHESDIDRFCLQKGNQPKKIFDKIIITIRNEEL